LTRDQELDAARDIARMEQTLWETILENPAKVRFVLAKIRDSENLEQYARDSRSIKLELNRVLRLSTRANSAKKEKLFKAAVSDLCERLREVDTDRRLVAEAAQEAIARGIKNGRGGKRYISSHGRAVEAAMSQVEEAKHNFIKANQGLVTLIAKRFKQRSIPLGDLIQEGNLGLIKAVNRFDYTKGFQFCTYASWWIRASISRAIDNKEAMIRIPGSQLRTRSKLRKAMKSFRQKAGRNPTDGEIAAESGLGSLRLERAQRHLVTRVYSLDQEISDSNSLRYIDVLVDEHAQNPLEKMSTANLTKELSALMEELTPLERNIIHQRFGFEEFDGATLREIGEQYGLSRERIRQIQNRALDKIRSRISLDAA
jgi:RNA polymerase primary sigma factor